MLNIMMFLLVIICAMSPLWLTWAVFDGPTWVRKHWRTIFDGSIWVREHLRARRQEPHEARLKALEGWYTNEYTYKFQLPCGPYPDPYCGRRYEIRERPIEFGTLQGEKAALLWLKQWEALWAPSSNGR